ncbi:acyl carrier protein [Hymenobacter weizhouensis]|uniref:acyl carrier protein n=1 Tax=Hymenobacter sp. YIM 151500-1 TaxID=2987689 RepID=UPI0022268325|nr:acyl carrier protein [Hymenobacter sp. YIM 151500-1]UYZ64453.1 acyl carrier protein [Hymenobacter sp. YIM 151500-1]
MTTASLVAPRSIRQQVLRVIGRRKRLQPHRLRLHFHLSRELCFDLLDVVDIILELESRFHITIPDEVPLVTVGDVVDYVAAATLGFIRR